MRKIILVLVLVFIVAVPGCIKELMVQEDTQIPSPTSCTPVSTVIPTSTQDVRQVPHYWSTWKIVPDISARVVEIWERGLFTNVNQDTFSIIGDCHSQSNIFMGIYGEDNFTFDDEKYYYLYDVISAFKPSFLHQNASVKVGLSTRTALDPEWVAVDGCSPDESPVDCELRITNPMVVFIALGTNWQSTVSTEPLEIELRQIVDMVVANNSIPVLINKADNVEGDQSINRIIAEISYDYDIPMINWWLASDGFPNHGLMSDCIHLETNTWEYRSLLALQTLDKIWKATSRNTGSAK